MIGLRETVVELGGIPRESVSVTVYAVLNLPRPAVDHADVTRDVQIRERGDPAGNHQIHHHRHALKLRVGHRKQLIDRGVGNGGAPPPDAQPEPPAGPCSPPRHRPEGELGVQRSNPNPTLAFAKLRRLTSPRCIAMPRSKAARTRAPQLFPSSCSR